MLDVMVMVASNLLLVSRMPHGYHGNFLFLAVEVQLPRHLCFVLIIVLYSGSTVFDVGNKKDGFGAVDQEEGGRPCGSARLNAESPDDVW